MPESSWPENDSFNELEPIGALLAELSQISEEEESPQPQRRDRRRRKAALVLALIWCSTIGLHLVAWGSWVALGLSTLMGIHAARVLLTRPLPVPDPLTDAQLAAAPLVTLMVAAKNEEAVIERLVKSLCDLDYPTDRYEVWVIDDDSSDQTPVLLDQLTQQYPQLRVFHRPAGATGGKSGALNQILPLTQGEVVAVFDADAQVSPDLLRRVLPLFDRPTLGAVQVRKAVSNGEINLWTQGQVAEMALDSFFQQQRIAIGGIGELRGNGQFVRRTALERCGGWNEETITDDLDLTLRLHLDQWDIDFMMLPAVLEEGVTQSIALWHQRSRWAEGGYQRYLDYWKLILSNRLGFRKTMDLGLFWITQYVIPTAAVPDLLMTVLRSRSLLLSPMTNVSITLSVLGMMLGLRQIRRSQRAIGVNLGSELDSEPKRRPFSIFGLFFQAVFGTVYMLHWFPVIASTTARMSVRPKRLKWVKTTHQGATSHH
jgi:1,2-diacylglycerol 3-beta-glucosyltransferase